MIVVEQTNTYPPIAGGTFEAQYFGGLISPGEMLGQFCCHFLVRESSNLNGPLSRRIWRAAADSINSTFTSATPGCPHV